MTLTVSKLAREAGVKPDTIRYYEKAGLLPAPPRTASGYREYGEDAVERLRLIKGVQRSGLRLREVRELLEVLDRGACPCGHTQELVARRIEEVDAEVAELIGVRDRLLRLAEETRSAAGKDPATGQWPCQQRFIELGGR